MKLKKKVEPRQIIDKEVKRLLETLESTEPTSKDYKDILDKLSVVYGFRRDEKKIRPIDIAPIVQTAGNLFAVLAILNYEQTSVITSKAFGIFMKGVK